MQYEGGHDIDSDVRHRLEKPRAGRHLSTPKRGAWAPELLTSFDGYGRRQLTSDVVSGIIVGIVALPLAIAFAIQVGVVLAAFLFMRRMSEVTTVTAVTAEFESEVSDLQPGTEPGAPAGVAVYEINGPFFFGAADKFRDTLGTIGGRPRALILRMRHVMTMDSTGIHALREVIRRSRYDGTLVLLSELRSQPLVALDRAGVLDEIGEDSLTGSVEEALERVRAGDTPAIH